LLQEEAAIGSALTDFNSETAFDVRQNILAAAEHAGNVGADGDVMTPNGLGFEHRIERCDFVNLHWRQLEIIGDAVHQFAREVTVILVLGRA
jgi:hypothetical protein